MHGVGEASSVLCFECRALGSGACKPPQALIPSADLNLHL